MSTSASTDPRQQKRIARVKALFSWEFQPNENSEQFQAVGQIIEHHSEIDSIILKYAPKRKIVDFNKMDLAILRQGLYELEYTSTPAKVVINEAIEIAKEYGSDQSASFVNGVLGNYWDDQQKQTEN